MMLNSEAILILPPSEQWGAWLVTNPGTIPTKTYLVEPFVFLAAVKTWEGWSSDTEEGHFLSLLTNTGLIVQTLLA